MAVGTMGGAEVGAQLIQMLKRAGNVNFVVSVVSIAIYVSISSFMIWEAWRTFSIRKNGGRAARVPGTAAKQDESSFSHRTRAIQRFENLADGFVAGLRRESDLALGDHSGFVHRRVVQRVSRGRRRLHPDADAGLRPRNSHPSRGGDGPFRDHHLRELRNLQPRDQRQRRYPDCAGHAHRRRDRGADRRDLHPVFRGPENPARLRAVAVYRRGHRDLHPNTGHKL